MLAHVESVSVAQTFDFSYESWILAHFNKGLPLGIGTPIGQRLDLVGGEGERNEERFDFVVQLLAFLLGHLSLLLVKPMAQGPENGGHVNLIATIVDTSGDNEVPTDDVSTHMSPIEIPGTVLTWV